MIRVGLLIAVCLLVAACSGQVRRPPANEATRIPESGDWFCQLAPSGEGWDCVQDPQLAEHPAPDRLPQAARPGASDAAPPPPAGPPSAPPEGGIAQSPDAAPDGTPAPEPRDAAPAPETPPVSDTPPVAQTPPASRRPPVAGTGPASEPEPAPDAAPVPEGAGAPDNLPRYLRLAYQPPAPMALMELPPDLYAVQVLAMNTREELDRFVRRHKLPGLSSARVESDGRIYYVLLLGVYEDLATARAVLSDLPPPFDAGDVWIRPLRSLQAAMARADALARSGRP